MKDRLTLLSWNHPRLGRMQEAACLVHEGEILRALRTLGIGGSGEFADPQALCLRCLHPDYEFRVFSDQAVVPKSLDTR